MPNRDISRGFFYTVYYLPEGSAKLQWAGRGSGDMYNMMINMTITELHTALSRIFSKIGISAGFSLYNINFAERDSEAAMAGGRGKIIVFD